MPADFESHAEPAAGASRGLDILVFLYFGIASAYCAVFVWNRTFVYSWPEPFGLWHIRIAIRCLFHWAGFVASLAVLKKYAWGRRVLTLVAGVLSLLAMALLLRRGFSYYFDSAAKMSLYDVARALYITSTYQIFSFFMMMCFFLYYRTPPGREIRQ